MRPFWIGVVLLTVLVLSTPPATALDVEEAFAGELAAQYDAASKAYDANRFEEAIAAYKKLQDAGHVSEALFFNLANAYFKNGELGLAILNYRRAQYVAPRDPDTQANLAFARDTAGIAAPNLSLQNRLAEHFSFSEWVAVAVICYWGLAVSLGLRILYRRSRGWTGKVIIVLAVLLLLCTTGLAHWFSFHRAPEVVITGHDQDALFAPLQGATAHFATPEGTILRVEDREDQWLKVRLEKQAGWIRADVCETVYPWSATKS